MDTTSRRNWIIGAVIALIVIIGIIYYMSMPAQAAGTMYVSVSDASADIQNVSDVSMTVSKVEMHSQANGWVTVSNTPQTFDLLTLKANGNAELAAKGTIPAGEYDQVRATVSKVEVKGTDGSTKTAVMGSNTMVITGTTKVAQNQTSHANIDIDTSDSMHTASSGTYVFTPVVHFKSEDNANVTVNSNNSVTTTGGTTDADVMAGADLQGTMHLNAALSPNVQIQINGSMPVMVTSSSTSNTSGSTSTSNSTSNSSSMMNANGLVQINTSGMLTNTAAMDDSNTNMNGSATTNTSANGSATSNSGSSNGSSVNVGGSANGGVNVSY